MVLVLATWGRSNGPVPRRTVEAPSPGLDTSGPNIPKLPIEPFQHLTGTAEGAIIAMGLTEELVGKPASFKDFVAVLLDPRRPELVSSGRANRFSNALALPEACASKGMLSPLGSSHRPHQRLHPVGREL